MPLVPAECKWLCWVHIGALLAGGQAAFAHDLGSMEQQINESEPYTQLVDKPAPSFSLQTADGQELSLEDFRGKTMVMYFLYARCKDDCPLHSLKIREVQEKVARARLEDQIQFVAIATDIEDAAATAELMKDHPKRYGLDPANWLIAYGGAGRESAGLDVARAYGLEFVPAAESVQIHGIVTHLIDPEGRMRARYHGLDFNTTSLVSYAAALLHGDHGAVADPQSAPAESSLTLMDWVLSALGLVCLALLVRIGWTCLILRDKQSAKTVSSDP